MSDDAPAAPAGWYPHPDMADTVRYWDGQQWTGQVAPTGQPAPTQTVQVAHSELTDGQMGLGALLGLVFPIGGIVLGLAWVVQGGERAKPGVGVLVCSLIGTAIWAAVLQ